MKRLLWSFPLILLSVCTERPGEFLEVQADEFSYAPGRLEVEAGEAVQLTMANRGRLLHDLNIDLRGADHATTHSVHHDHAASAGHSHAVAPGVVHLMAGPKEKSRIVFTVEKPGRYEIYCSIPGHREAGMRSELIVREKSTGVM